MSVLKKLAYGCVPVLVLLGLGEGVARLTGAGGMMRRRAAEDSRRRILAIGDSCTFGWGVEQDDAYPQVLQQRLDRGPHAGRCRVINAGVPGYTSYQGRLYLAERGLALEPAAVIAGFGFNDIVPSGDVKASLDWQRRIMPLRRLDDALLDSSRLRRWIRIKTLRPPAPDAPVRSSPAQFGENIREIVRLAREAGARPVLIDFLDRNSPQREHIAALHGAAEELGVPLIVYEGPRIDVVHPTAERYIWLAGEVERRLDEIGAVKQ